MLIKKSASLGPFGRQTWRAWQNTSAAAAAATRLITSIRHTSSANKPAFEDKYRRLTFGELHRLSSKLRDDLCSHLNKSDLAGEKIAVLCANNYTYLVSVLGIWMANGTPIGLNKLYPNHLLDYFINDSKSRLIINGNYFLSQSPILVNINMI